MKKLRQDLQDLTDKRRNLDRIYRIYMIEKKLRQDLQDLHDREEIKTGFTGFT